MRAALDDVSLTIGVGEHVCILGPNGCGKSTLIKVITRECYPLARDETSVRILGKDRWNVFELRAHLGIVSPDLLAACSTDATGRDVVLSGYFSSTRIFPNHSVDARQIAHADELLAQFGVSYLADRPLVRMSSGEAKRVLIARALVHAPQSLLFDEPSNALDVGARVQLLDTMSALARSGVGVVLVTHHVSEIVPEIDRVVMLRRGKIVADGAKEELLTSERLSELFETRVQVERRDDVFHVVPRRG